MAHRRGHICHCLGRIRDLRRGSLVAIAGDRCRTGEEFVEGVLSLARGLSECGVGRGDVVAIGAFNSDWYVEWLLAVTYIGGIAAPLNYRWSFEEARSAMEVVNPVMLVVDESCSSWALALQDNDNSNLPALRLYALVGASSSSSLGASRSVLTMDSIRRPSQSTPILDLMWAPNAVAFICFTSGTTGRPKGVAISHAALVIQSLAKIAIVGYDQGDVYLHTAPLCHIGGISSCIAMLMAGGCHVFLPKFDAKSSFQAIAWHRVTSFIIVPAIIADLITFGRKSNKGNGGETVKKVLNGGGGLSNELIHGAAHLFPHAKIISAYGMTETCSSLTFMILRDPTLQNSGKFLSDNHKAKSDVLLHKNGGVCVGKPALHVELRICGNQDSSGSHLIGNILTRGLHVMVGYWDRGIASVLDSVEHGWLDTGDVGWLDGDGDLLLIGRKKDRIKSGGENVYPEEVEAILSQHPGILSVVVVGIPDARLTEKVVACVAMREEYWKWIPQKLNHSPEIKVLSDETLQNHCRQRNLSGFKIPKLFIPWSKPWPLTSTGKLKREVVRKEAISYTTCLHSSL